LNKPATWLLKAYYRTIRPFFRFALASSLGEMAYPWRRRLIEPSITTAYARRRASRSVLLENGPLSAAVATRYGLFHSLVDGFMLVLG
jgi:hypothetical protein